jgi:hypothetical protein
VLTIMRYFVTDLQRTWRIDDMRFVYRLIAGDVRQVSVFVSVLGWRSRNEVEEYKYTVASMENENKTNYIASIGV